jgi:hypothetical protein
MERNPRTRRAIGVAFAGALAFTAGACETDDDGIGDDGEILEDEGILDSEGINENEGTLGDDEGILEGE